MDETARKERTDGERAAAERSVAERSVAERAEEERIEEAKWAEWDRFPEYRSDRSGGVVLPGFGLTGILIGLNQLARGGAPLYVLIGLPLLLVALYFALRAAGRRSVTLTDAAGITVRTPLRTRTLPWRDIQAIEIQGNPAAVTDAKVVAQMVVVYDAEGRKTLLPHINSKMVPSLPDDVRRLRALWEQRRGPGWTPRPETAVRVARDHRSTERYGAWMVGMAVGLGGMVACVVLFLVLLLSGALDGLDGMWADVFSPVAVTVVPGVVCGVAGGVLYARRGRGRGRSRGRGEEHGHRA